MKLMEVSKAHIIFKTLVYLRKEYFNQPSVEVHK